MPRLYKDFISVDPNFIPVFSKSSDITYPDKWQSFYPHESFKTILTDVVDTLEKSSESKNKSLWMRGTFGTGKTYASFVVKHILEDDLESIKPYFDNNGMQTLYSRICGIRSKGKTLVVHRSSSAGINNQNRLFNSIIESVKDALRNAGYSYMGGNSLLDKIVTTLTDPNSSFNFSSAFNKYKAKFTEYSDSDEVVDDLQNLDADGKLELLDVIIEVADAEGFGWSLSPSDMVNWLEDVRKNNGIYAIVFIWDEFTEYFKNNQNNIGGLQEIAMNDSRIGFYFFLITHASVTQLIQDQTSRKIIEARFKQSKIELGENTAFKLLGQALHHNPDLSSIWQGHADELWDGAQKAAKVIKNKDTAIKDEDFKNLLPMHPYAAYLLKNIAKDISSDTRTIFQFLSGDYSLEKNMLNFKWFIENTAYEFGKWNYLTTDYLWDYFFNANNPDLDETFTNVISHYNNFAPLCTSDDQRRVLKVTLLLAALQQSNGADSNSGRISLLRPTLINIKACFAGTPIELNVENELNYFDAKGIVGKVESGTETLFVMTSASIDKERLNKCLEEVKKKTPFEALIENTSSDITKPFLPMDKSFLSMRLNLKCISVNNADKVSQDIDKSENHIPTFYLFAKNEGEQAKVKDKITKIFANVGSRCIVVDFTQLPLTDNLYNEFVKHKAEEEYFKTLPNQKPQYELAKKNSAKILSDWSKKLFTTTLNVYDSADKSESVTGGANLRKKMSSYSRNFYGCGLEDIDENDKLFSESGFKETVAQMAMGKIDVPSSFAYLRNISSKLEHDDIWSNKNYWTAHPNHVVSKMRIAINEVIDQAFENSSMVSVEDIWNVLQKPPYGLMANAGSTFLMGFLLKEYADSNYYKRDMNNNTVALNYNDLSELIYGIIKGLPKAKGQFIVKQTPEQTKFCQITGDIFKIPKANRNSLDDILKGVNKYLIGNNYPLWSIKNYIEEELSDHTYYDALIELTELLCEFVRPESKIDRERSKVADDIYRIYKNNSSIEEVYTDLLSIENMRSGMEYYIAATKPELTSVATRLHIDCKDYLAMLTQKFSADASYLWQHNDIDHQIDNLYVDLKLVDDINILLTTKQKTEKDARNALVSKLNGIKIPDALIKEYKPELNAIFNQFYSIKDNSVTNKAETSRVIANMADDFIEFFNNQFETFEKAVNQMLSQTVTQKEASYLFDDDCTIGALYKTPDQYANTLRSKLSTFRRNEKTRIMKEEWKNETGSATPSSWSQENGIPVLCMFTDDIVNVQSVFNAINGTAYLPNDNAIDNAIAFIKSGKLNILKDKKTCEKIFVELFTDSYAYVVDSVDELRDQIRSVLGNSIYDWYAKSATCKKQISTYATNRYNAKYRQKAKEQIKKLSAQAAQDYLNALIDNDPLLGIRILKDQEK